MRRRVHDLLRRAVASDGTRAALSRGMLLEEPEAAGFAPFAGKTVAPGRRQRATAGAGKKPSRREEERDKRRKALQEELAHAEKALEQAERAVAAAEREQASAERGVAAIRAKLDRLTR
jgi:septal ring factor EnvC (AmiA/AmiB activator)